MGGGLLTGVLGLVGIFAPGTTDTGGALDGGDLAVGLRTAGLMVGLRTDGFVVGLSVAGFDAGLRIGAGLLKGLTGLFTPGTAVADDILEGGGVCVGLVTVAAGLLVGLVRVFAPDMTDTGAAFDGGGLFTGLATEVGGTVGRVAFTWVGLFQGCCAGCKLLKFAEGRAPETLSVDAGVLSDLRTPFLTALAAALVTIGAATELLEVCLATFLGVCELDGAAVLGALGTEFLRCVGLREADELEDTRDDDDDFRGVTGLAP